jgi:hypothetical protein
LPNSGLTVAAAQLSATVADEHCLAGNQTDFAAALTSVQDELLALHGLVAATYFVPRPQAFSRASQTQVQSS